MKILIIEDRPSRQQHFLPNNDVETIRNLDGIFIPLGHECISIISQLNEGLFNFENTLKLIVIHKSALNTSGLIYIHENCKRMHVNLICFSGGISQTTFYNDDYEILEINSANLYTDRLIPFLKNVLNNTCESTLEVLSSDWRLSYLLLARQILYSLSIEKDDDAKYNFEEKLENISRTLNLNISPELLNLEMINTEINKRILSI